MTDLGCDFDNVERLLDLEMMWGVISMIWKGFSTWKWFGM